MDDELDEVDIPEVDLHELGCRALSVAGPFGSLVIVSMPKKIADVMFPDGIPYSGRRDVIEGVERDLDDLRKRDPVLAESALAMSALALAYDMSNPYTSATARSMCAGRLLETLDRLGELAPSEEKKGALYDIRAQLRAVANPGSPTA